MTFRLTATLAVVMLGNPLLSAAAGAAAASAIAGTGSDKPVAQSSDLPQSRDALFDMAPEDGKGSRAGMAEDKPLPASKDDLFALEPAPDKQEKAGARVEELLPSAKEALFGEPEVSKEISSAVPRKPINAGDPSPRPQGFFQAELAHTFANPDHWSKAQGRLEVGTKGRFGQGMQWKLSGRFDYNAIYDLNDFYQPAVRDDQRAEFQLRETYLDLSAGGLDWRLGRQHIVWGEMVGLFFADVVSAKDLREFILPDFQILRIPQWAARAEYFAADFHAETVWIPFPSYDRIGKPKDFTIAGSGADFYPFPWAPVILDEVKPGTRIDHGNFGVRLTQLTHGWDLSGFYYTSMNSSPTFYRDPVVKTIFTPRHDRIWQAGGTLGKDFGDVVLKAEAVYSAGRRFNLVTDLADADGVVKQNTLDWAVGLDFNPDSDTRVNTQLFQRYFFDHHPDIIPDKAETGMSLLVSHNFPGNWKGEALLVHSLNRSDWMLRPKASWGFQPNWKLTFGLDLFGGPPTRLFGQYDDKDRAYAEIRHDF
jgi:hypothetical protein